VIRLAHVIPVARAALLDLVRRRDVAVAGIFTAALLALLAGARAVGLENPATGTLLLNLGLTLAVGAAHLMTLLLGARQFPEELENRTLYPLLARPVRRAEVLAGKWIACVLAGTGLYAVLTLAVLALAPRLEFYDHRTGFQMVALQIPALMTVAAWAMLLSLLLPKGPAVLIAGVMTFASGALLRLAAAFWLVRLLPDVSKLDLALRYTDGIGPLPVSDVILLAGGAAIWILLGLAAAAQLFAGKRL